MAGQYFEEDTAVPVPDVHVTIFVTGEHMVSEKKVAKVNSACGAKKALGVRTYLHFH